MDEGHQRLADQPGRRVRGIVAGLLALAVLVFVGSRILSAVSPAARMQRASLKVAEITVQAPVQDGRLTGKPLTKGQVGAIGPVVALSHAVHVDIQGGRLGGQASLSVPVPLAKLPRGARPERDVYFLTRTESDGPWVPVGGQYHPDTKTMSLAARHFSDWMLGVTDPQAILRDWAYHDTTGQTKVGQVAAALWGTRPPLSCSDKERPQTTGDIRELLRLEINDSVPPEVKACLTRNDGAGGYELEVSNSHGFPIRFELSAGMKRLTPRAPDEGVLQALVRKSRENGNNILLMPASKVRLGIDAERVLPGTRLVGTLDLPTALVDSALAMLDAVTRTSAAKGRKVSRAEELAVALQKHLQVMDCFYRVGDEFSREVSAGAARTPALARLVFRAVRDCTKLVMAELAGAAPVSAGFAADTLTSVLLGRIDFLSQLIAIGPGIGGLLQTEAVQLGRLTGFGDYRLQLVLADVQVRLDEVLPVPGESLFRYDAGNSFFVIEDPIESYMLSPSCTHGLAFNRRWAVQQSGMGYVLAKDYGAHAPRVIPARADVMLIRVHPGYRVQVEQYFTVTKRDCSWIDIGVKGGAFTKRSMPRYGRISVAYAYMYGADPKPRGIVAFAYSRGYVLRMSVQPIDDSYTLDESVPLFERALAYAAKKADSRLGTAFTNAG